MKRLDLFLTFTLILVLSCNILAQWTLCTKSFNYAFCFTSYGKDLFVGTENGVFLITDNGVVWKSLNYGLAGTLIRSLAVESTSTGYLIFSGTNNGLIISSNFG
jgi:ligand-binding sensor domain-containing protein